MTELNKKLNDVFDGFVVRKDLVKLVKGNASVPSYVLEFLLGQNCATDDEAQIEAGVQRVKDILAEHYVQRDQAMAIRSDIKMTGYKKVIDRVTFSLNEKKDVHEASFENLGISKLRVDLDTARKNRRLLVSGVWCISELGYAPTDAKDESPFILKSIKPIQMPSFDFDEYIAKRNEFTMDEWIDVLIRSIGLDPEALGRRAKLFQLTRLIAYCERNYNLIELGPKGTGKSHVYSEFSPHGTLISGGEVTPAKLFVNNSTGRIGLVGYWDCVAFDEFAGKNKRPKADIVDIMKNYMANKSFSRGVEQVTAEASMVFVGNTSHDVSYMINQTDLFEDLPAVYHDSAFIDRFHAYIPGWEMDIVRGDMFSSDYGFIVDYLAEALRAMRPLDFSGVYRERFELSDTLSTRDKDGIQKTYAGLMKIIFPGKNATAQEEAELIEFALELRKRVKDSLYRIDETFDRVDFAYRPLGGQWIYVETLEEINYPKSYHALDKVPYEPVEPTLLSERIAAKSPKTGHDGGGELGAQTSVQSESDGDSAEEAVVPALFEGRKNIRDGQRGVSYEELFGPYLEGVNRIEIVDPFIRKHYQCRNLVDFIEVAFDHYWYDADCLSVHLITAQDSNSQSQYEQTGFLDTIAEMLAPMGIDFTYQYKPNESMHGREVRIDDRWSIILDRGLDMFKPAENEWNGLAAELRRHDRRRAKPSYLIYQRLDG